MTNIFDRKTRGCRGAAPLFHISHISIFIFLIFCLTLGTACAQDTAPRIPVDGSSLAAGDPFVFTITVNSDEAISFADAQTRLSALLCPVGQPDDECQTMNVVPDSEDAVTMRVTFEMEELPFSGDYNLDMHFTDETGTFAEQTASYLITGVREGEELSVPVTVKTVTLRPELIDPEGNTLIYSSALYVNEPYTFRLIADSPMNDSVSVNAAIPASLSAAPVDPASECLQFLNADRTALTIPGSRWSAENNNVFSCGLSFTESAWVTASPITFSIVPGSAQNGETYEMAPLSWSYYPVTVTKYPASHQLQITDQRGNLLCSDTVPCGLFNEGDTYILTYRFPAEWGSPVKAGRHMTASLRWPEDWAEALQQTLNRDLAAAFGDVCTVNPDGTSELTLTEISEGRYQVSCAFSPVGLTSPSARPVTLHLNDNAWAVNDLNVTLPSVVVPAAEIPTPVPTAVPTEAPTETPTETATADLLIGEPVQTQVPEDVIPTEAVPTAELPEDVIPTEAVPTAELSEDVIPTEAVPTVELPEDVIPTETVPTAELPEDVIPTESEIVLTEEPSPEFEPTAEIEPLPEIEIEMTVKPVHLTPSFRDEAGNNLIYGSTLYVGEPYYLQIDSDSAMNDSAAVVVNLPASLLSAPVDPFSECLQYMSADGTSLRFPGSFWNEGSGNSFRCELRYTDSTWLSSEPFDFTVEPSGFPAPDSNETYAMDLLSWNYYPVNIIRFSATHQAQITDSRGNLVCSDTVPCGVFNADDVYTLTYKFPADWGTALPSGKSFSADISWPSDWAAGLQNSEDWAIAAQFGDVCAVGFDGMTHFELNEVGEGRYSASCTFVPGNVYNPSASAVMVHLNDAAYQVSDLNVMMPSSIVKRQAVLSPSLTLEMTEGAGAGEQIGGGSIGRLYRTVSDFPNLGGGFGLPALYTLKATIEGVSAIRTPQFGDHVEVRWGVLDALAQTGDLPYCLTPTGNGYELGNLHQTEEGTWQAECSFRFPVSIPENTGGDVMTMELVSGLYSTSASVSVASQPFAKQALKVNLEVPGQMVLSQDMDIRASLSDETGGLSDYTRTILAQTGLNLYSDWIYNYLTTCQGTYDLTASGEDTCTVRFDLPTDQDSDMHFSVDAPGLDQLFNIEFVPAADFHVAQIRKTSVSLATSLSMRMESGAVVSEQISGGYIGTLYRTVGDYPNSFEGIEAPAYYQLRADVSGLYADSQPMSEDYVLVNWNMLDEMAATGDLPACLVPTADGYQLGTLESSGENNWTASCGFYFPQTMSDSLTGGPLHMELVSAAYEGSAEVQMNGAAFRRENLYVTLEVPQNMLIRQLTEFHARISDDSGGLSDYARAILNGAGAALTADWEFNYLTTCQGFYDIADDGNAVCEAMFENPVDYETDMHFEFASPAIEALFNVSYSPAQDFRIQRVTAPVLNLSVKLFHAGTEMPLPASESDAFVVGDDYQLQFYLTPDPEFRDIVNAVAVDGEGLVIDWWMPLTIRWDLIPGGETGLNFYRDGENFVARYDFNFAEGGVTLDGNMKQLVMEAWIDGWDIRNPYNMEPVQLPTRIEKKPTSLTISDFTSALTGEVLGMLHVDEETGFDVNFSGSLDHFDPLQLTVGYETNGIRMPIDCFPDPESGSLHCTFVPECTDFSYEDYASVCGTNLTLFAEYNGDPYNDAAAAESKTFNVYRNEVKFFPVEEGSLSKNDMIPIESVQADMESMGYASMTVGGWNVDSFLPREIRSANGSEYRSYPVIFRYEVSGGVQLDESALSLIVEYQSGTGSQPVNQHIELKPRSVVDDKILFELDFGSFEMLDDGRTVQEALEDAAAIIGLSVRYAGSPLIGAASAKFAAEDLTFALKVAGVLDFDLDISVPGTIRFSGAAGAEMQMRPFTVYCSQLYEPLQCSSEPQLTVLNENGEPVLSEIVDDGCWGKVQTAAGRPEIYVNNSVYPQCYAAAWNEDQQILIGMDW
ncbi:MAG: hypothetical protein IJI14_12825 [Anaerolineaceae bacterium]|nr:hypothetical protein [Anaerolineaceae bacterium]